MIEGLLDNNYLYKLAAGFRVQSGLNIGVYDISGKPIVADDTFSASDVISAINKLGIDGIENVVDLSVLGDRTCAVGMRALDGELCGVWLVSAPPSDPISFDKHLILIESVLTTYLKEREDALSAILNIKNKDEESSALSKELSRNATITEILSKMESEDEFEKVAGEIIELCGKYLGASNVFIMQLEPEEDRARLICEWHDKEASSLNEKLADVSLSSLPFADALSYTISSDSRMPEDFKDFLDSHEITAGIFLPMFLDDVNVMYLCASMTKVPRHWSLSEAGFLSDVRRILSTILAKRIAKNSMASSFAVVESVLENIGCGVMVIRQGDGTVLYTNDTFREMFADMSDKQRFERRIRQTPEKMQQIREYFVENANIYVSIALGVIRWVDESEVRLATVFDISENKEFEKRIEKQANLDELTGIYNRTYFIKELGNQISGIHGPGAYLCLNIGGFKEINVTSGSDGGDLLLSSIAKFLLKLSGDNARVYRLGADEFAVMIKDTKQIDPVDLSESIIKRFLAPWQLAYKDCYLTVAIGITLFPKDADDVTGILRTGAIALSAARERGAGSVCFFEPALEKALRNKILLRSFLFDAVENDCNGMTVVPTEATFTVNNADFAGDVYRFIFNAPELGEKEPVEYMPIARKRRIVPRIISKYILDTAKECRYKNDFGYPDYFAAAVIEAGDFCLCEMESICDNALKQSGVNPDRMVLILKGDVRPQEAVDINEKIDKIRKLGIHVGVAFFADASRVDGIDCRVR